MFKIKLVKLIIIGCTLVLLFKWYLKLSIRNAVNMCDKSYIENQFKDLKTEFSSDSENTAHLSDFTSFPCVPKYSVPFLSEQDRCVRTVNVDVIAGNVQDYECVDLNIEERAKICIHDPRTDMAVSMALLKKDVWEKAQVDQFSEAITRHNVTDVLDLGCNIGVYTIKAAKMGKRVVALDANIYNHRLLAKSLILSNIRERVTQIWNAISDVYANVTLKIQRNSRNIGGSYIRTSNKHLINAIRVETIKLDDLENMFRNKVVAIKIDVEGCELMAMKGGASFLKNVDVRFIQMEIGQHTKTPRAAEIVSILKAHGLKGYTNCLKADMLEKVPVNNWPWDVCFVK